MRRIVQIPKAILGVILLSLFAVVLTPVSSGAQTNERGDETATDAPPEVDVVDDDPVFGLGDGELAEPHVADEPAAVSARDATPPVASQVVEIDFVVPRIAGNSERLSEMLPRLDGRAKAGIAQQLRVGAGELASLANDAGLRIDQTGVVFYEDALHEPEIAAADVVAPAAGPFPNGETFSLHSKPGSNRVIYLDFTGHVVAGTAWAGGATINVPAWYGASVSQSEHDFIQDVWQRVAEDYAPFDVDVTTQDPGAAAITRSNVGDTTYGSRVLITPGPWSDYNVCGSPCGGVAYVGTFDWYSSPGHAYYQPAWVHAGSLSQDAKNVAEASSHEAGHNLGLSHDGDAGTTYYGGHNLWAPIMGNSYDRPVSQWSKGEYAGANQFEDDFTIIQINGLGYRNDDHSNSLTPAATDIVVPFSGSAAKDGIITTRTDLDTFEFVGDCAAGSVVTFSAQNAPSSPNLDIQAQLYNSAGALLTTSDPTATYVSRDVASGMDATITRSIQNGQRVYLRVDGVGTGTASTGYTDYASVGQFTVAASEVAPSNDNFPGASISGPSSPYTAAVTATGTNCGATKASAEPAANGGTVWYNWTAPTTGKVFVSTCDNSTDFDTFLQVYTGTNQGALSVVASNQDASGAWCDDTTHSRIVSMPVTQGTNYKVRVRGWDGDKGNFAITIKYHWCIIDSATFTPTIIGTPNAETLTGTAGADTILAYGGNDVLDGLAGNDRLCGGFGNDRIYGRDGADSMSGDVGDDFLYGHGGNDRLYGGGGNDFLDGFSGDDLVFGQNGNDRLEGFSGIDVMYGGSGVDTMLGEGGADRLYGNEGNDVLIGGDGNDRLFGGNGLDELLGGNNDDFLYGQGGADDLSGQAGNDVLVGGPANDVMDGGTGDDRLSGAGGNDTMSGGADDDKLYGNTGNDTMFGNGGNDFLGGNGGADDMDGGGNSDTCYGGPGSPDTAANCEVTGGLP